MTKEQIEALAYKIADEIMTIPEQCFGVDEVAETVAVELQAALRLIEKEK